ncbi:YrbL family protein [Ruegeria atlantica]|uniref:YrbL family protein n=1 Tax=Ruegeria atlantica TaxID=81569 RepID=UPI00147E1DB8|nr:YrbL family protein [Ruegeria atlantica]
MEKLATLTDFIDLSSFEKIANGKQRNIYLVRGKDVGLRDGNQRFVLKVPRRQERLQRLSSAKRLLRKIYPASSLRVIRKEAEYWKAVSCRWNREWGPFPFPRFVGFVETSEGIGALWNAVCDHQGNLAPQLKDFVDNNDVTGMLDALNQFVRLCMTQHIVATDLQYRNVVFGTELDRTQLFLVDGFGDHRMVSFRRVSKSYNRSKLVHSCQKLARQTNLCFQPETGVFSLSD